jgi:hypothetical protein
VSILARIDDLDDAQVTAILGTAALTIGGTLVYLIGPHAVDLLLGAGLVLLLWNRGALRRLVDEARDDADLALRKAEAIENHLAGLEPPGRGRHTAPDH